MATKRAAKALPTLGLSRLSGEPGTVALGHTRRPQIRCGVPTHVAKPPRPEIASSRVGARLARVRQGGMVHARAAAMVMDIEIASRERAPSDGMSPHAAAKHAREHRR